MKSRSLQDGTHTMKPYQAQNPRPKWHERASRFEINEIADIDRLIADLRQRRERILNRIHMRTNVWVSHHQERKRA